MRRVRVVRGVVLALMFLPAAACRRERSVPGAPSPPPVSAGNTVASYLRGAALQFENERQAAEIQRALADALTLPPETLRERRYADYALTPGSWDVVTLVHRYFVPARPVPLDADAFYRDVGRPEAQRELEAQQRALETARGK